MTKQSHAGWAGRLVLPALVAISLTATGAALSPRALADNPLPPAVPRQHYNPFEGVTFDTGSGTIGQSSYNNVSSYICSTDTSGAANVNTDCDARAPHNETSIAINPTNPLNLIGSANDYQLRLNSGGQIYETVYSRAHVTTDGGKTWREYGIPFKGTNATGDPAVAFDASGRAYLATLGFRFSQGKSPSPLSPDVLVSHSTDGGVSWTTPSRVGQGTGNFGSPGTLNDKEYIAAWGNGNAIVTWTVFNQGQKGAYINSPIYDAVTHDGGTTWSTPTQISGAAPFCIGVQTATSCDTGTGSVPVVARDGRIYVAFETLADATTGRDQYVVVQVDPATGQRMVGPYRVATLVDGATDYPINVDGRQTYQDSQFRTWSLGNITADPTNAQHLAVVWSDMRNSPLPAPADPYKATTNSDVVVSQSFDSGQTWSAPVAIAVAGDQFMPWAAYDTLGKLRIGYFDRSFDPANHKYGYTLATETAPGELAFTTRPVSTALSDPTTGNRWFAATVNPAFPFATTFLGDYSGIATTPNGGVVSLWTDLRNTVTFGSRSGAGEDAYFAATP